MPKNNFETLSTLPVSLAFGRLSMLSLITQNDSILLVTTKGAIERKKVEEIKALTNPKNFTVWSDVSPNPTITELENSLESLKECAPSVIIAFGGGSVIDSAKVLRSALSNQILNINDLLKNSGQKKSACHITLIAIPTTAGTGSEVTPFATIWDDKNNSKLSLSGIEVCPDFALVDGKQCLSLDEDNTLYSALDSISHSLESLWNKNSCKDSRIWAFNSLELSNNNFLGVLKSPNDLIARDNISKASTFAGIAISSTRTAVAHSISYPLTSIFGVPHGLACSFTLGHLLKINLEDISENSFELKVLTGTLGMLMEINFRDRLEKYLSLAELLALNDKMSHPDRIGNYSGKDFQSVGDLLRQSFV